MLQTNVQELPAGGGLEAYAWREWEVAGALEGAADLRLGTASLCKAGGPKLLDLPVYVASSVPTYAASTIPMYVASTIPIFTSQPVAQVSARPIPAYDGSTVTCDAVKVVKLRVTFTKAGQRYVLVAYFWTGGSKAFGLAGVTPAASFTALEPTFDQVAASFTLR